MSESDNKYLYKSPYEGSFRRAPKATPIEIKPRRETPTIGRDGNINTTANNTPKKQRVDISLRGLLEIIKLGGRALLSVSPFTWIKVGLWLFALWCFSLVEFGSIFFIASIFVLIFINLGERKKGELSAYSVFNPNFAELPGTTNARQMETELRGGM
eukprot:TRINITY_DN1346_c0_g2_i1.p1 TRINITY_DN1346_c0_g2~~TRINITY_DN1346_c0_g2_i1.p1  ORF type:complete len:157 (-),score=38.66 TRINITY_DN1346_c0_g2_i1:194-664(-)